MRKFKIYSSIALISGLVLVLTSVLIPIIKFSNYTAQNGSIGIIGGADMPTLLFSLRYVLGGQLLYAFALGLTLFLSGGFCLVFKRVVINNCSLKTTALSLIISFFGASGLVCFFIWYSIVAFHEMSIYPIAYPCSIFAGLLSLMGFVTAIVFYIRVRKKNLKPKGIIIDILTSIITLPTLFLLVAKIYAILQSF